MITNDIKLARYGFPSDEKFLMYCADCDSPLFFYEWEQPPIRRINYKKVIKFDGTRVGDDEPVGTKCGCEDPFNWIHGLDYRMVRMLTDEEIEEISDKYHPQCADRKVLAIIAEQEFGRLPFLDERNILLSSIITRNDWVLFVTNADQLDETSRQMVRDILLKNL